MCGRYYVDDEMRQEIKEVVKGLDYRIQMETRQNEQYPTGRAAVIWQEEKQPVLSDMAWGFLKSMKTGVIYNARSETVLEKQLFSDSVKHRRCLIPARGFYEWDRQKNKHTFKRLDGKVMFMAGAWNYDQEERRFVIITTKANDSVIKVHDRMPLVIETDEIDSWLYDGERTGVLLQKSPLDICRTAGYLQETLPF